MIVEPKMHEPITDGHHRHRAAARPQNHEADLFQLRLQGLYGDRADRNARKRLRRYRRGEIARVRTDAGRMVARLHWDGGAHPTAQDRALIQRMLYAWLWGPGRPHTPAHKRGRPISLREAKAARHGR